MISEKQINVINQEVSALKQDPSQSNKFYENPDTICFQLM